MNKLLKKLSLDNTHQLIAFLILAAILIIPAFFNGGLTETGKAIIFILTLPLLYFSFKANPKIEINFKKLNIFSIFIAFIVIIALSLNYSINKYSTFIALLEYLSFFIILFSVFKSITSTKQIKNFALLFISFGCLLSLIGIYYFFNTEIFDYLRLRSVFNYHNPFGGFLLLILPISLIWLIVEKSKKYRLLLFCSSYILLFAFILTHSRASWLSLIILLPLIIWILRKKLTLTSVKNIIFLILITALSVNFIYSIKDWQKNKMHSPETKFEIVRSVKASQENTLSPPNKEKKQIPLAVSQRLNYWKGALKIFKDNPILGTGFNTFATSYKGYIENPLYFANSAHNTYLQILSELGTIGFSIFTLLILLILYLIYKSIHRENYIIFALTCGILAALIHNFFENDWQYTTNAILFWIIIGILYKSLFLNTKNKQDSKILKITIIIIGALLFISGILIISSNYFFNNGKLIFKKNNQAAIQAQKHLEKANILNPLNPDFKIFLANSHYLKSKEAYDENYKEALKNTKETKQIAYGDYRAYFITGLLYNKYPQTEKLAKEEFEKANRYAPMGLPEIQLELAKIYFEQKEYKRVINLLDQNLKTYSEIIDSPYWFTQKPKKEIRNILSNMYNLLGVSYVLENENALAKEALMMGTKMAP